MITAKYFSYLVRIWQGDDMPPAHWLASLEDPSQKRTLYIKSMEDLFAFLRERTMLEEHKPGPQKYD